MPDTGAYDRMYDRQLQMMQATQSSELEGLQAQLLDTQRQQESLLTDLRDARTERAESVASVEAEARRMSNIIGPPPPEESAKAPVVGAARDKPKTQRASGKRGLRIGRAVASSSGDAVGLNIV
jgi:hypothetical protein